MGVSGDVSRVTFEQMDVPSKLNIIFDCMISLDSRMDDQETRLCRKQKIDCATIAIFALFGGMIVGIGKNLKDWFG